ncbi:MAG: hypothetical protein ACTHKP_15795, partial [Nitrososphaeraceae archaeon]
ILPRSLSSLDLTFLSIALSHEIISDNIFAYQSITSPYRIYQLRERLYNTELSDRKKQYH